MWIKYKKKKKKAFTLIEIIIATIIIAFIYVLIAENYKEQYSIINNFNIKVKSISLWQQWYNFINYLFISRKIQKEKENADKIINWIKNQKNTDFFLDNWTQPWLNLFYDNNTEIPPNNITDWSYWTLKDNSKLSKISWPDDTDHMPNIGSFNLFNYWEDRIWPFYYVQINKEDTGVKKDWNIIYKLKFIEHFIFKHESQKNNYTFTFTINPLRANY